MGRRIIAQKRGSGRPTWRATIHSKADVNYPSFSLQQKDSFVRAQVIDFTADPVRYAVLAEVVLEDGSKSFLTAAEGLKLGQQIQIGKKAELEIGNVLTLSEIPEGCPIFAVEKIPGDGGQLIRSSGVYGLIVTKDSSQAFIKMPSGKILPVSLSGRATIGNVCGGGRVDKPFVKAGVKFHLMKAKSRKYPRVRGVAMNVLDHPFGGSQHHPGKSKSTSRHAAPGRKVGAIASSRTGRRKKN